MQTRQGMKAAALSAMTVALAALVPAASAEVSPQDMARLSVVQGTLATTPAPVVGNLAVSGAFDQGTYAQGGFAKLQVAVSQPGDQVANVALVQAYPDGRVVQLFPNFCQQNNLVRGNNRFDILGCTQGGAIEPRGLWVDDGPGTYLVKLIASTDAAALKGLLGLQRADQLADRLQNGNYGGTVWSVDAIAYTVQGVAAQPAPQPVPQPTQPVTPVAPVAPIVVAGEAPAGWNNLPSDFRMSLRTLESRTNYRQGEAVVFEVTSEESCELGLVEVAPSGVATVVYPNAMEEVELKAGKATWLPGRDSDIEVRARELGAHHYLAICSRKPGFLDGFWGLFGDKSAAASERAVEMKPVISVQELLKDDPKHDEARAWVSIQVVQ